jgi:hypothetical protein
MPPIKNFSVARSRFPPLTPEDEADFAFGLEPVSESAAEQCKIPKDMIAQPLHEDEFWTDLPALAPHEPVIAMRAVECPMGRQAIVSFGPGVVRVLQFRNWGIPKARRRVEECL